MIKTPMTKKTKPLITLAIALVLVSWISYESLVTSSSEKPKAIEVTGEDIIIRPSPVTVTPVPEPTIETTTIDPSKPPLPKPPKPKPSNPKLKAAVDAVAEASFPNRIHVEVDEAKAVELQVTEVLAKVESTGSGYGLVMPAPAPARPVTPASPPVMVMAPAPPVVMASPPSLITSSAKVLPYRELIRASDLNKETNDLMSFVLFVNRPVDQATKNRYIDVCKYWEATLSPLSPQDKVALAAEGIRTTPMYWLTKDLLGERNCDSLYSYDFEAASKLSVPLQADLANSSGPFLVLMRNKEHQHLVLDISKFSPPDIQRAFDTWRSQVCKEDPMSGAKITKFREYFRALVQDYGESILKVMEGGG